MVQSQKRKEEKRHVKRMRMFYNCYNKQGISPEGAHCLVQRLLKRWGSIAFFVAPILICLMVLVGCSDNRNAPTDQPTRFVTKPLASAPNMAGYVYYLCNDSAQVYAEVTVTSQENGIVGFGIRINGTYQIWPAWMNEPDFVSMIVENPNTWRVILEENDL